MTKTTIIIIIVILIIAYLAYVYFQAKKDVAKEQERPHILFAHDAQDNAFLRIYSSISKSTTEKELITTIKAIEEFRKTFGENEDFDQLMNKYALMEKKILG